MTAEKAQHDMALVPGVIKVDGQAVADMLDGLGAYLEDPEAIDVGAEGAVDASVVALCNYLRNTVGEDTFNKYYLTMPENELREMAAAMRDLI